MSYKTLLKAVVAVVLVVSMLAFVFPALGGSVGDTDTYHIDHEEGEEYDVGSHPVVSTATEVNQGEGEVTYEITDEEVYQTETVTIAEGDTATVTLLDTEPQRNVTVTTENIEDEDAAQASYDISNTYGWESEEESLFQQLPTLVGLMGLVALLVIGVRYAL